MSYKDCLMVIDCVRTSQTELAEQTYFYLGEFALFVCEVKRLVIIFITSRGKSLA